MQVRHGVFEQGQQLWQTEMGDLRDDTIKQMLQLLIKHSRLQKRIDIGSNNIKERIIISSLIKLSVV